MSLLADIAYLIVRTAGQLFLIIIMMRFLLQIARADFYNPFSQFITKATNPLLIPLRRVIPGVFGVDLASLVLILAVHLLLIYVLGLLTPFMLPSFLQALTWAVICLLSLVLFVLFWSMLIMVIASWIAPMSHNPFLMLIRQLVEPFVAPFRRLIPPMGGLDFSVLIAILALNILELVVSRMAYMTGLNHRVALYFGLF